MKQVLILFIVFFIQPNLWSQCTPPYTLNITDAPVLCSLSQLNGMAFVADDKAGLQIVNYMAFDSKGIAPTATATVEGATLNPSTQTLQILEGHRLLVKPVVRDDVQVRNVELLINGQVIASDVSYPYSFTTLAPTLASGVNTLVIQVRATDTGGNSTLSDLHPHTDLRHPFVHDRGAGAGPRGALSLCRWPSLHHVVRRCPAGRARSCLARSRPVIPGPPRP